MTKHGSVVAFGAVLAVGLQAAAQTSPGDSTLEILVTAKRLDEARSGIQPSLGATKYDFSRGAIEALPQGELAPLNQVLLRAPGVAQDSFGQVHVRGDHGSLQYRLDGVQLPEGLSVFNQALATQYARKISLITGALPAQYGFLQAGVVDIALKSGLTDPGAEASMTAGSRSHMQPSFSYGGHTGSIDYFATAKFLHNGSGLENPEPTSTALHNDTDQWHGLGKITATVDDSTRLSFIAGGSSARFQIPQRSGATPTNTVSGNSTFNSALLDQRQWEDTYFGMASLQRQAGPADFQISVFMRSSSLSYQPDALGDLMFNGISPWARRTNLATGVQADASLKTAADHTLRGGFLIQRERATSLTNAQVLPVDGTGTATTDQPMGIVQGADFVGWLYGVYVQDAWKLSPTMTMNVGARFDVVDGVTQENQFSPRLNFVWEPNDILTARVGYARLFTPPPLAQVTDGAIAAATGTTAASAQTTNNTVRAERAHYFDGGFDLKPTPGLTLGFGAYYKIAKNQLDKGQFGAPIVLTPFNYADAHVKGVEFTGSYDLGPWSIYGNLSWSEAQGSNINSAEFNFTPANLAFIRQNYIYLDHNQSWTGSAGLSYAFNPGSDWATRVAADFIYGNGLRRTVSTPNDQAVPPYGVVNLSAVQRIAVPNTRGAELRFDVLNVLDSSYQLRDGTGVGVGAPQYGLRRTFLVGLNQKF